MKKTILCALAIIALFANCTRNGEILENKNNAEAKSPDLIIKDIYYAGNFVVNANGYNSEYTDDKFISIYNPTDHDISLENTALALCQYNAVDPVAFDRPNSDYRQKGYGVSNLIGFPKDKSGKPYVVKAGQTIVIAMKAINHAEGYKKYLTDNEEDVSKYKGIDKLIDLSKADFEWGQNGNDEVPHMTFLYCKENDKTQELRMKTDKTKVGVWDEDDDESVPFSFERNFTIALVRLAEPIEKIKDNMTNAKINEALRKEVEDPAAKYGRYVMWNESGHHSHSQIIMFLPNEWVVDAVNVRYKGNSDEGNINAPISGKLDKKWNGVYTKADDNLEVGAGKMLTRRFDGKKFSDIDDSSVDFEVKPVVVPNK
jgi:hypothetical protein